MLSFRVRTHKSGIFFFAIAQLCFFHEQALFAQTEVQLPSVVIEASLPADLSAPTAGSSRLDGDDLEAMPAETLSEAIASLPGVLISPTGTSSSQTTLSLRGSTSNQVLILVDGVRITDIATGAADLSQLNIPLDMIDRIEIQRGSLSAAYGADAVGGVLHIHTKTPDGSLNWKVSLQNVSFLPVSVIRGSGFSAQRVPFVAQALVDSQQFEMQIGARNILLWSNFLREANLYPYYDANGVRRSRTNADVWKASAGIRWAVPLSVGKAALASNVSWRNLGIPGSLDAPTPEARQHDWNADISAQFSTDAIAQGAVALNLLSYARAGNIKYRESSTMQADEHLSYRTGLDANLSWIPESADWIEDIRSGCSLRYDRLESTAVKKPDESMPERITLGIFAEPRLRLAGWAVVPAIRFDWTNDFPSGISAGLGLLRSMGVHLLGINVSTAYRAPSFDDLYWPASGGAEGNPFLQPESAVSADISLQRDGSSGGWRLGTFARYSEKVILWQPGSDGIWRPSNFGNALYPGLEAEARWKQAGWQIRGSYTFLYSFVLSGSLTLLDDRRVPYVPVHSAAITASRKDHSFSSSFTLHYKSLRYTSTGNIAYLPSVFTADAQFAWDLSETSTFEISASNLFNERHETVKGYPMPGFSISAKYSIRNSR